MNSLELTENPDILAGLVEARRAGDVASSTKIVGFAAETGDESHTPLEHGKAKLLRKGCDLLMCNEVGDGKVFGQRSSQGWLLHPEGDSVAVTEIPFGSKLEVAARIWDGIESLSRQRRLKVHSIAATTFKPSGKLVRRTR